MTHPTHFWQSILARPDDDAPRLHYANYLDGCSNPLGEFIRLQCAVAQEQIKAPHIDYERRAQDLLGQHQAFWSEALAGFVQWCSFRRGFVEEIALTDAQFLCHGAALFRNAPVFDVHVRWTGMRLDRLPQLPDLVQTLFLDISSQKIGDGGAARLAHAPLLSQIHGLNLASNCLGDDGLDAIHDSPHLSNLRELYLGDNSITDDGIRRFVMSPLVEQLDKLDVRYTQISRESVDVLRRILGEKLLF
jgi:uncharacterized protein (TIGR02996 family)